MLSVLSCGSRLHAGDQLGAAVAQAAAAVRRALPRHRSAFD